MIEIQDSVLRYIVYRKVMINRKENKRNLDNTLVFLVILNREKMRIETLT